MNVLLRMSAVVILSFASTVLAKPSATRPTTQPLDPDSPRAALKAYSDQLPAGGMKAALAAYHTTDDKQRDMAKVLAHADMVSARLETYAREKFGNEAVESIDHAMRLPSDTDLLTSREKIEGDHASITWADERDPLKMIKIDGQWKVDVADLLSDESGSQDFIKTENQVVEAMEKLLKKVNAGEFSNAYLLERAVKQQMFRILGDEDAPISETP